MVNSNFWAFQSAAWRLIIDPHVNVSGWRAVKEVHAHQSGAWRLIYKRSFVYSPPAITVDVNDYNLSTAASGAGWNGVDLLIATITNNAVIGSSTLGAAFTIPSLPAGSTVSLTNNGYIVGKGGNGANGGFVPLQPPGHVPVNSEGGNGTAGGLALSIAYATTVVNNGVVGGGGGGGGGGGATGDEIAGGVGGIGGGGAGRATGTKGASGVGPGSDGMYNTAGTGGGFSGPDAGSGGDGGFLGSDGAPGGGSSGTGGGLGGAQGAATSGYANVISWTGAGSTYGALG